jgi:hypothetical protein
VLPDPPDQPALLRQRLVHALVAFGVRRELRRPVGDVALRHSAVLRAGMPEAAVEEHGDLGPGEDDVRMHAYLARPDEEVLPKPKTPGVQLGPKSELSRSVAPPVRNADLRRRYGGRLRIRDALTGAEDHLPRAGRVGTATVRWSLGHIGRLGEISVPPADDLALLQTLMLSGRRDHGSHTGEESSPRFEWFDRPVRQRGGATS